MTQEKKDVNHWKDEARKLMKIRDSTVIEILRRYKEDLPAQFLVANLRELEETLVDILKLIKEGEEKK